MNDEYKHGTSLRFITHVCSAHFFSPQPLLSQLTSFVNSYQPLLSTSPLLSTFFNSELTSFVNNINHLCRFRRGHHFCQQGPTIFVNRNCTTVSLPVGPVSLPVLIAALPVDCSALPVGFAARLVDIMVLPFGLAALSVGVHGSSGWFLRSSGWFHSFSCCFRGSSGWFHGSSGWFRGSSGWFRGPYSSFRGSYGWLCGSILSARYCISLLGVWEIIIIIFRFI